MATILTLPAQSRRGVIVFTTQDRDKFINFEPQLKQKLSSAKSHWIFGLHHNWHDHNFKYDPFFDFSMAGDGDLIEVNGQPFHRIGIDACNFSPRAFAKSGAPEKFWDIIAIPKISFFKRLPLLLETFAELYQSGIKPRVLCITPMPQYDFWSRKTMVYDARDRFDRLFQNREDRMRFTFLTPEHDYPFPFDLPTLAHLYRSSKAFVHFADDERRCRIAAYAWAAGLPVVARDNVASLLPEHLRREPFLFRVDETDNYITKIRDALKFIGQGTSLEFKEIRAEFIEDYSAKRLISWLHTNFNASADENDYFLSCLDIRFGRHHGFKSDGNMVGVPLNVLTNFLINWDSSHLIRLDRNLDPERSMEDEVGSETTHRTQFEPWTLQFRRLLLNLKIASFQLLRSAAQFFRNWYRSICKK